MRMVPHFKGGMVKDKTGRDERIDKRGSPTEGRERRMYTIFCEKKK